MLVRDVQFNPSNKAARVMAAATESISPVIALEKRYSQDVFGASGLLRSREGALVPAANATALQL